MTIGDTIELDDINAHMDFFYVVRGAVEFTMREDPIHKARKEGTIESDASLMTESVFSYNS